MCDSTVEEKIICLVLKEEQAHWLKGLVQNPIDVPLEYEDQFDSKMREYIFKSLKRQLD